MNSIAYIFKTAPHGSSSGREGLDALLATAALSEDIGVFFIGEGVFHLVSSQQPNVIYARDYITTFKLLELYDIENVYVCQQSLVMRGITEQAMGGIPVTALPLSELQQRLSHYDKIISF
ncbi:sulfurtransferase complex subunit TusC [Rosenbergiella nectarea]|uniref:sulfurtransferase complex subunit TusC n=1 Tax=Rosenbergiella nectarea TaxID=988801 RepID=UPI001BD94FE5|nr:sulfurtransferase complex subunit TusC [Rosenbergiella nectarea]MBT0730904.1 sulfurtransferase complex subunit TusC [Rosenbergiella nectarea subsp. apis]